MFYVEDDALASVNMTLTPSDRDCGVWFPSLGDCAQSRAMTDVLPYVYFEKYVKTK